MARGAMTAPLRRALCLRAGIAALAGGLGGCTLLAPAARAAPVRHTLPEPREPPEPAQAPAAASEGGAPPRCAAALRVRQPGAQPGADTDRMVYLRQDERPQAYTGHRWADTPANLLWPRLVRALALAEAWSVVLPPHGVASEVDTGRRLDTQVVRLQQTVGPLAGAVRFTLDAWLIDPGARRVLAWRRFDAVSPTARDDAASAAQAAARAVDEVLRALVPWAAGVDRDGCAAAP
jgi:ABC-type uncharacterized transport system auxiliary subunit